MAEATVVKPDLDFVKSVISAGGESLKKCYQCATCSVVCNVTPDNNPFPRKEMLWAQWGLSDKFKGNPDVWLCHQCNDCTAYCPRGAKPGEVLGAIRKQTIRQYSSPGFMVGLVNSKLFFPILFLIPALILFAVGNFDIPEGEIKFTNLFSVHTIQFTFTPAFIFGFAIGILGVIRFWKDMSKTRLFEKQTGGTEGSGSLVKSLTEAVTEVASHKRFKDCGINRDRYSAHLLIFYGFVALGIATAFGVLYIDILGMHSPFRFGYGTPVKIFGTIGAAALFIGVFLAIENRFKHADKVGLGSYFDWLLILIITIIMASGILAWVTRLAGIANLAYPIYFIHLLFVFSLFLYLPYSKLAHLFYRTAAICYGKYSGRK